MAKELKSVRLALAGAALLGTLISGQAVAQTVRIAVGVDTFYMNFYVAKHEKLFAKHGVNAELIGFASGPAMIDGMTGGQADLGASSETTIMGRMARVPDMRAVAVTMKSGDGVKLVARSEIDDPKKIKTFGAIPGSLFEYLNILTMQKYGMDPASVKKVGAGAPELPALLIRGDIDAFWLFEPFPTQTVKQGGARILGKSKDIGYTTRFWLATTKTWLDGHQAETKKILAALAEACVFAKANPEKAAAHVNAEAKVPVAQVLTYMSELECVVESIQRADLPAYEGIAGFQADAKLVPARLNPAERIVFDFVGK